MACTPERSGVVPSMLGQNGRMGVFSRSFALFRSSWGVLRQDKELLALPIISSITSLLCVAPFIGLALLSAFPTSTAAISERQFSMSPIGYVFVFLAYLVGAYVTIFFQSALVLAANERLGGGSPTLGWALSQAASNAGRILPWAIISATVSVVLQAIQERAGFIGRIVVGLIGLAWTLVTFLVLPILVIEQVGVKDAFTRSAEAFKKTWGENVVVNGGIGLAVGLITFAVILVTMPVLLFGLAANNVIISVVGFALVIAAVVAVAVLGSALSGVFRTVLYRYAVLGEAPAGFSQDQIEGAFRPKRVRSGLLG